MNKAQVKRLENLLERALTEEEIARLRRIKTALEIDDNDGIWDVLTAMEYQRAYYEELPAKIAGASTEILQSLSVAAEKEVAQAQSRLAESVVEQAKKLSIKINMASLLPAGMLALVCLLLYGSLLLWAGFVMGTGGSGQAPPLASLLKMPSGVLMGGLCLAGGIFPGVQAGREYADGGKGWPRQMLIALAMLIIGGLLFSLAV